MSNRGLWVCSKLIAHHSLLIGYQQSSRILMSKPILIRTKAARAPENRVSLSEIQAAMGRIRESIYLSPCARSENFSQLTGNSVYLKLDNLQRTGAFKERGALNKLLTLTPEERSRGVIAASAGNPSRLGRDGHSSEWTWGDRRSRQASGRN